MDEQEPNSRLEKVDALEECSAKHEALTEEVLRENERLRLRVIQLEAEEMDLRSKYAPNRLDALEQENRRLREKSEALEGRFGEVAKENMDFANLCAEVQLENENLMNLYVASYQLHSSLDPEEVLSVIQEIIINLVGAEEFLVFLKEKGRGDLLIIAGGGPDGPVGGKHLESIDSTLGSVLEDGESYFANGDGSPTAPHLACAPLKVQGTVVGAISITKLLDQKSEGLTTIDREILDLLSAHAATALVSADLHSRTGQGLRASGGFVDISKSEQKRPAPGRKGKLPQMGDGIGE